jgi:hypothetical protein
MPDRPDPVTDRLARFTPNATGLDRDAVIFAAGQRAARGSRLWPAAAALLAVSQVVTLVSLWPRSPEPPTATPGIPAVAPSPELNLPPVSRPRDVLAVGSSPDILLTPPNPGAAGEFVSSGPPLTAGSALRFD